MLLSGRVCAQCVQGDAGLSPSTKQTLKQNSPKAMHAHFLKITCAPFSCPHSLTFLPILEKEAKFLSGTGPVSYLLLWFF